MNESIADTQAIDNLDELKKLVSFSKKFPAKFDWKKNLNEWQVLFADYILSVAKAMGSEFVPTPKQAAKVSEIVARMTLV